MSNPGAVAASWRASLGRIGVWVGPRAIEQDPGGFTAHALSASATALCGSGAATLTRGPSTFWSRPCPEPTGSWWRPGSRASGPGSPRRSPGGSRRWRWPIRAVSSSASVSAMRLLFERLGYRYERPVEAMARFLTSLDDAAGEEDGPRELLLDAPGPRSPRGRDARSVPGPVRRSTPLSDDAGSFSEKARRILGNAPLLAPEQALVLEAEPAKPRVAARAYISGYLSLPNYRANLGRLGFGTRRTSPGKAATSLSTPSSSTGDRRRWL